MHIFEKNTLYTLNIIIDKDESLHILSKLGQAQYNYYPYIHWIFRNNPTALQQGVDGSVKIGKYQLEEMKDRAYYDECVKFAYDIGILDILREATHAPKHTYSGFFLNGGIHPRYSNFFNNFTSLHRVIPYQVLSLLEEGSQDEAIDILVYWGNAIMMVYPQYPRLPELIEHIRTKYRLTDENTLMLNELLARASTPRHKGESVRLVIPRRDSMQVRNTTFRELQILRNSLSPEIKNRFITECSEYLLERIRQYRKSNDCEKYLAALESYYAIVSLNHVYTNEVLKNAFLFFNSPQTPTASRVQLLNILKQRLPVATSANFRKYTDNGDGNRVVHFSNKLLFNRFCILIMELLLDDKSSEETDRIFKQQISKISEELKIETFDAVAKIQDKTKAFYWILKNPIGIFACDQTEIAYEVQNSAFEGVTH
ncbi:MAG: hypothetical protein LBM70_10615 [Victivallales bacterium]|jgi:hypothetical protein|nr:hypothetical protein [Victivallales bacterium]